MSTDFKAMLDRARLPERTVYVCVAGDLLARHEELERRLVDAQAVPHAGIEGGTDAAALAEEIRGLEDEMRANSYPFRLRALNRPDFRALVAAHPPRKGPDGEPLAEDVARGFHADALFDKLVPLSVIDPVLSGDDAAKLYGETLTDGQYNELAETAWLLNCGDVDIPFSRAASRMMRSTEQE